MLWWILASLQCWSWRKGYWKQTPTGSSRCSKYLKGFHCIKKSNFGELLRILCHLWILKIRTIHHTMTKDWAMRLTSQLWGYYERLFDLLVHLQMVIIYFLFIFCFGQRVLLVYRKLNGMPFLPIRKKIFKKQLSSNLNSIHY